MPTRPSPLPRALLRPLAGTVAVAAVAAALAACGGSRAPSPEAAEPSPAADDRSVVERDAVRDQSYSRIEEMIQGRAPGVQVIRRPDGNFSLRIRGLSSPTGQNDPLLVVDGMHVAPAQMTQVLLAINPQDVLRIEVLKDAASTAFYGMRGANGVIVITTRRR